MIFFNNPTNIWNSPLGPLFSEYSTLTELWMTVLSKPHIVIFEIIMRPWKGSILNKCDSNHCSLATHSVVNGFILYIANNNRTLPKILLSRRVIFSIVTATNFWRPIIIPSSLEFSCHDWYLSMPYKGISHFRTNKGEFSFKTWKCSSPKRH